MITAKTMLLYKLIIFIVFQKFICIIKTPLLEEWYCFW